MENFDINKTCCFTGHRILSNDFNIDKLEEVINIMLKREFKTFLVGMAIGFDFKCFEILLSKKQQYKISFSYYPSLLNEYKLYNMRNDTKKD